MKREDFQAVIDSRPVDLFTLKNRSGLEAKITNHGGRLVELLVPDRNGELSDIVLGYDTLQQTMGGQISMGATVGRVAGRINQGKFSLDGKEYQLSVNNGAHHHHGGLRGSRFVVFDARQLDCATLQLTYHFKDGEEGYPGNCLLKTVYALTNENELIVTFDAVTDKPTIVNFINHTFFNLKGAGNGSILDHELTINADYFTPIDETLIPTGEFRPVKDTVMDFTRSTRIGARISSDYDQIKFGHGYDHNYIINRTNPERNFAARVYEPFSGRIMEIYTTEPGIQLYTGNFLEGQVPRDVGKGGSLYRTWDGFCLETQHFPDSPNKENFPSTVLRPGEWFFSQTIHKFLTR